MLGEDELATLFGRKKAAAAGYWDRALVVRHEGVFIINKDIPDRTCARRFACPRDYTGLLLLCLS